MPSTASEPTAITDPPEGNGRTGNGHVTRAEREQLETDVRVLIEVARQMRERAYAPYSGYLVGAALLSTGGLVFGGCNVENAAYSVTICAERSAVVKAVGAGEREFAAIAVVTENEGTPCGECRQVLSEFGGDTAVILSDLRGRFRITTVDDLLPFAFDLRE